MTDGEIDELSPAERSAWMASLSDDEWAILHTPVGYLSMLLTAAFTKHTLARCEMTAGDRLRLLEGLANLVDARFSAAALAVIEPACDTAVAMIMEAHSLDTEGSHGAASYRLLTSWSVFGHFVRLNPSLLAAIRLMTWTPPERKAA
jgi:hypothetical protein